MKFLDAGPWTATINAERVPPGNFHPGGQLAHNALRDTLASRVGDLASNVPLARHQTRATRRAKIEFLGPLIDVALVFSSTLRKPCRRRRRLRRSHGLSTLLAGVYFELGSCVLGMSPWYNVKRPAHDVRDLRRRRVVAGRVILHEM